MQKRSGRLMKLNWALVHSTSSSLMRDSVGHGQGGQSAEFDGEVTVAHRIQGVFTDTVEAEQFAGALAGLIG